MSQKRRFVARDTHNALGSRSRKPRNKKPIICLALCASLLMLDMFLPSLTDRSKQTVMNVMAPALSLAFTPVETLHDTWQEARMLVSYKERMQFMDEENKRLRSWIQTAMMLESENKRLREAANAVATTKHDFVTASILVDGTSSYSRTLLIRTDNNHQVDKGQGVVSERGLIGRIIESNGDIARILLLSDINSRIPVVIEQTGDRAILAGQNATMPILDHLPDHHQVHKGMKVVTSGHGGIFPYGVPVGEVRDIPGQGLGVALYVDPGKAHYVQVVNFDVDPSTLGRSLASMGQSHRTLN